MSEKQQQQQQHNAYHIGGVKVLFPAKPYPSQLAMMAQITKGLKNRQNCLLESPTGSGKTLALLCASLAWQREQIERAERHNSLVDQGITDPDILAQAAGLPPARHAPDAHQPTPTAPPQAADSGGGFFFEDDDYDFRSQPHYMAPQEGEVENIELEELGHFPGEEFVAQMPRKLRVPKIFIGTRTHKQVEQVVKELRRTAYRDVRMVVLSSREHTCIHPVVSVSTNKNDKCAELMDPMVEEECRFYYGANKIKMHSHLASHGLEGAWDIEDLVRLGRRTHICPYFTARSLLATAELVICPYNYLVDPLIRESMDIQLRNHVVVLDEAHNIEDSAREAASCTFTQDEIREARNHLEGRLTNLDNCAKLASMLSSLSSWIDSNNNNLTELDYGTSGRIMTGTEFIAVLDNLDIGRERYEELKISFTSIKSEQNPDGTEVRLNPTTNKVLSGLFLMYYSLYMDNMKYKDDYRVVLMRKQVRKKFGQKPDGWIGARPGMATEYSINFWCLNPAVAFSPISAVTHSIILTSGTLSPMSSFQSELGVPFRIQLEANHVIDNSQILVGTVGRGPRGKPLQATYQFTESWDFQDELGQLVLSVCQRVPGGILCFLPSYSLVNKLYDRWQDTGVWDKLRKVKVAMTEQKKGEDFKRDMANFYATIQVAKMEEDSAVTGAFFMAVYRGKVSEGLDLTDDNARAVIAVGLPYPNFKDVQVNLKKKYNDAHTQSRGLLSGRDWYDIQAYRAINQALGRCIRHRYDWGALIIVDQRYQRGSLASGVQQNQYTRGLSKWVRNKIVHYQNCSTALNCLEKFVKNMVENPPAPPKSLKKTVLINVEKDEKENQDQDLPTRGDADLATKPNPEADAEAPEGVTCSPELFSTEEQDSGNKFYVTPLKSIKTHSNPATSQSAVTGNGKASSEQECERNHDSTNCDAEISLKSKKRPLHEELDLEDFNLTLSPAVLGRVRQSGSRRKTAQTKGVLYEELD